jgi:hypothetical protein
MFKVGDRVRVITQIRRSLNRIGTVTEILDHTFPIKVEFDNDWIAYREDELELYVNGVQRMVECLR